MDLLNGIREWQFRRADDNFWRQATPALREQFNPGAASVANPRLERIKAAHLRNGASETAFACRGLARADSPTERTHVHEQYRDRVLANAGSLGKKFGVTVQVGAVAPLAALDRVCARRAGVSTRRN